MKNVFVKVAVVLGVAGLQMACGANTQAEGEAPSAAEGELALAGQTAVTAGLGIVSLHPGFVSFHDEGQEMTIYGEGHFSNSLSTAQRRSRGVALVEDMADWQGNKTPCTVNTSTWTDNCCAATGASDCCAIAGACTGTAPSGRPWNYVYCVAPEGSSQPVCLHQVPNARNIMTIDFAPNSIVTVQTPSVRVLAAQGTSSKYYSLSQSSAPSTSGCVTQRNNPAMCARALHWGINYEYTP